MKILLKKLGAVVIASVMLLSVLPLFASADDYSGSCGDNLTYSFDSYTGLLEISGTGKMEDYDYGNESPWESYSYSIKSVSISSGVTRIDDYAFRYCSSIKYFNVDSGNDNYSNDSYGVLFNKGKTELIRYPAGSDLTSYDIPYGVKNILVYAFYSADNLENVTISDSVKEIWSWTFSYCSSLTSLTIPAGVTSIDSYATSGSDNITDYYVDSDNEKYSSLDGVLFNKDQTKMILYPAGNTRTSYTVPDTVKTIDSNAFGDCDNLTNIIIPSGVKTISEYAFGFCDNLANITVDSENPNFVSDDYGVLFNKKMTKLIHYPSANTATSYIIPYGVKTICSDAFYRCENLKSLIIPDSVKEIGLNGIDSYANIKLYYSGDESQWKKIDMFDGDKNTLIEFGIEYNYELDEYTEGKKQAEKEAEARKEAESEKDSGKSGTGLSLAVIIGIIVFVVITVVVVVVVVVSVKKKNK